MGVASGCILGGSLYFPAGLADGPFCFGGPPSTRPRIFRWFGPGDGGTHTLKAR